MARKFIHQSHSVASNNGPESGSIWKQVMPALYGYFSFMAVLAVALWLRWIVWRRKGSE